MKSNIDTLCIAYIGDSWAAMHNNGQIIEQYIYDKIHRPVKVYSFGICGLTSKEIYESFFDHPKFKAFLQERGYQYCFISAGINDTYKKMSTNYYQRSMGAIIHFFVANRIHPVLLEIPDYDIKKAYQRQQTSKKFLRKLSMLINRMPLDCKQTFRSALLDFIAVKDYQDKTSIIKYTSWNGKYRQDQEQLYLSDGMHLNENGYARLDSAIALTITNHYFLNNGTTNK